MSRLPGLKKEDINRNFRFFKYIKINNYRFGPTAGGSSGLPGSKMTDINNNRGFPGRSNDNSGR
jgi:hypothetical protein